MRVFGDPHYHLSNTSSTNDEAKILIQRGSTEGTLFTTDFQTEGRGRFNRIWVSESGLNFLGSYITFPKVNVSQWGALSLLAAISIFESIVSMTKLRPSLKWPNDILVDGHKIAGVLIETSMNQSHSNAIIGIGINVNQTFFHGEFRIPPTSMKLLTGREWEIEFVTNILSSELDRWYSDWQSRGNVYIKDAWTERTYLLGEKIRVDTGSEILQGIVIDLNEDASLKLIDDQNTVHDIHSGEIIF